METVLIISVIVVCITIIICTILIHFKDITDYYKIRNYWTNLNAKVDRIYIDLYSNQTITKVNEMDDTYEELKSKFMNFIISIIQLNLKNKLNNK